MAGKFTRQHILLCFHGRSDPGMWRRRWPEGRWPEDPEDRYTLDEKASPILKDWIARRTKLAGNQQEWELRYLAALVKLYDVDREYTTQEG